MRSEQEMFDLILNTAREDKRIRAVYMNRSRTNPSAPRDIFQDYDIVYVVRETRFLLHVQRLPKDTSAIYESIVFWQK